MGLLVLRDYSLSRVSVNAGQDQPAVVVINAAPVQGVETEEAIRAIQDAGVEVCPVVLHQRKPFASRIHEGRTATEIEPKGKAAAETQALLLWICEKVLLLPK
jgi:chromosome partitioning protein